MSHYVEKISGSTALSLVRSSAHFHLPVPIHPPLTFELAHNGTNLLDEQVGIEWRVQLDG